MNYGDFPLNETIAVLFTTRAFATGIPGTLSTATVAVYEDTTATPIQTSVAVTESLNGVAGLNAVPIVATAGNGYNVGSNYHVVIEAGTVGGVPVVGEIVAFFSIGRSATLAEVGTAGAGLTDLGGMSTAMRAQVNTEVDGALDTALSEIGVGVPDATPSLRDGVMLGYMALRNKLDVATSGTDTLEIHNDSGTRIAQKLLTDDGSDYSEAQMISGA